MDLTKCQVVSQLSVLETGDLVQLSFNVFFLGELLTLLYLVKSQLLQRMTPGS